jgi:hypothetical protein
MKRLLLIPLLSPLLLLHIVACQKTQTVYVKDTVTLKDTIIQKDTVTRTVKDTVTRTLAVKPGPDDGQDCLVFNLPPGANANQSPNRDLPASQWTYSAQGYGEATTRSFIEFTALDGLPDSAQISSATLYLTGLAPNTGIALPQGNSDYPGSPYGSPGNSCWLKRVLGNWSQDSITWNTMPPTTDVHEVSVPASTSQWNYNVTLNVTQLVQDIVNSRQNYGFCLQLQTEQIYRGVSFASSRNTDSTRWPKLVVNYTLH